MAMVDWFGAALALAGTATLVVSFFGLGVEIFLIKILSLELAGVALNILGMTVELLVL